MTDYKDTTNRHLRHKLQSLARRLDELEEAASKLQKSEDELLDLQDKIIQAEGSNSSLLNEVDALRKRVLKIEGKDEEVRKAEDLCRLVREKLEQEENLTKELKSEIERLQKRMAELEKLEEAFSKSKSDCTQLCLSLNEEKNLTKKLSSELEALKTRIKEVDASESRLDKAEQALTGELEKLKALAQNFVSEKKRLLEKQREDEKLILELTEKLEHNYRMNSADQSRNASNLQGRPTETGDLRIEDDLSPGLTSKLGIRKKSLDFLKLTDDVGLRNKSENEKNSLESQEDNKIKDLTQEIERLKNRLKQLELVEDDLKKTESKNGELIEKFQQERNRSRALNDQVELLRMQLGGTEGKVLENGKAENEEINVRGGLRVEKPKYRSAATESPVPKYKTREVSPQQRREAKLRNKSQSDEGSPKSASRALSPAHKNRRGLKTGPSTSVDVDVKEIGRAIEERTGCSSLISASTCLSDGKKPSVLSRYPPAANDQKSWKPSIKPSENDNKKSRIEKLSKYAGSDSESNNSDVLPENLNMVVNVLPPEKERLDKEPLDASEGPPAISGISKANGSFTAYRSRVSPLLPSDHGSEGHSSASETESTGSRRSVGEPEPIAEVSTLVSRTTTPKYPRYTRLQDSNSEGSSTRSSFEEEQLRSSAAESSSQEPAYTPSGIEIRRVCSPREALRSKAVIKPAIVEIDRKEVMMTGGGVEPLASNGKPKISTKPILTSKVTSSITIYPNDPTSSRTSSRSSSSMSTDPPRERHTSTSNIVISPSEHRSSISIPYEISIPKSEITLRPSLDDSDMPGNELAPISRNNLTLKSSETTVDINNDTESGFESSSSSSTTMVTSWSSRPQYGSRDDCLPEMRNVTVRSTWRKKGAASVDESGRGAKTDGSEDEAESTTTWRAYRATTILDTEELTTTNATRAARPSVAETYMRKINSGGASREGPEPVRRTKSSLSPTDGGLKRAVPHEPVCAQELQPWNRAQSPAVEETTDPSLGLWRKPTPTEPGSSYNWLSKTETISKRAATKTDLWQGPGGVSGRGQTGRADGRGYGGQTWNHRQSDN